MGKKRKEGEGSAPGSVPGPTARIREFSKTEFTVLNVNFFFQRNFFQLFVTFSNYLQLFIFVQINFVNLLILKEKKKNDEELKYFAMIKYHEDEHVNAEHIGK